jgi:hypothetical protein
MCTDIVPQMTFRLPLKSVVIARTEGSKQVRNDSLPGDIHVSNKPSTSNQVISLPKRGEILTRLGQVGYGMGL